MSGHEVLNIRATKILLTSMPWVISGATPPLDTPLDRTGYARARGDSELRLSHEPDIGGQCMPQAGHSGDAATAGLDRLGLCHHILLGHNDSSGRAAAAGAD